MGTFLSVLKRIIPRPIFTLFQPAYHYLLALGGALFYRLPSRELTVVGVTGTKGKSSVVELINAILEEAGVRTSLASTIRFKIADNSKRNLFKMTMPGRFFMQRFLRESVRAGCDTAIIEMTSEGVLQFREKWIALDALIFTNIAPDHIEAHGSFENYVEAKLKIKTSLENSKKRPRTIVANSDDARGELFLKADVEKKLSYSLLDARPYKADKEGVQLTFKGVLLHSELHGEFNIYNILAAAAYATSRGIAPDIISRGIEKLSSIPGRAELVNFGQLFAVVVDYAHTPESLTALYKSFSSYTRRICVLGSTGGGRDKWKRPTMGKIAEQFCDVVVLTNEDPYNENPEDIIEGVASKMKKKPKIILDRRKAIYTAVSMAEENDVVLISGKGTDPYIMEAGGRKQSWSDKKEAEAAIRERISKTKTAYGEK